MFHKLLCFIGFHYWRYFHIGDVPFRQCTRCKEIQTFDKKWTYLKIG